MYIITDAEDISHEHDNLEFLNSLNETDYMQLGTDIEALKNNKVDETEYNSKISELTTNITNEINRATEKENEILANTTSKIAEVENMLGGKSLIYLTQAEYDALAEEEKNNESIMYIITDAEDITHEHDNLDFLNSLNETDYMQLGTDIETLKTNKVDESEYNSKISELTTNINNEIDRATEKENELSAEITTEIERVEEMLGGKSFVYLTQAEYDLLTEEEKNLDDVIYFITDTVDIYHNHENKDFLDSLNEDDYMQLGADITSLKNTKLDASIYNEVVPGLVNNSHTHENQDFLDELNAEEFTQMNADITALKTSVSGKADTEHNHDDKYYTESEIDEKIKDINEAINGHVSTLQGDINTAKSGAISESKTYTDTAITNLVDSAPDAMNTLNDLAKAINAHQTEYEAYVATVSANITSAKNEAINEAGNKDEALHTIISKEIDDDVKKEYDRAVGVETGLQASITSLTNNKVDVAKYNDEVPGLLTAKHAHTNKAFLDELSSDTFAAINASITSLENNKLNKTDYNTDIVNKQDKSDNTLSTNNKTIVGAINELKGVQDNFSAELLELENTKVDRNYVDQKVSKVDAITLNGYSIWVGTSEELEGITKDPNTLYFEISEEEEQNTQNVVQVNIVDGVLNLTKDMYQKTNMVTGTQIVFPEVNSFTEIHLYFDAETDMDLNFPDCRWRVDPNIEAGKSYEIVATYNTIQWLVNVIVYS
jgi:hypothetical protein